MFIDRVKLSLAAGKGGNGVVTWRREKYLPKGGPTGGNGGRGGSLVLKASKDVYTLDRYRNLRTIKAEDGVQGGPNQRQGRSGKHTILLVPMGTNVKNTQGELLFDLTEDGQTITLLQGGKGGLGNAFFKSSTNQAPNKCTLGKPGERLDVELELKLIADIGLIGFPNAGKSTLLEVLTHAYVKIGAYPFTTLKPNIAVLKMKGFQKLFVADIPGIIESAHLNKGLGLEFLRHIERTKLLLYVLDASGIDGRDPFSDFQTLQKELKSYNEELLERPHLILLNKIDSDESQSHIETFRKMYKGDPKLLFEVCAPLSLGLDAVLKALQERIALFQ